MQRLFEENNVGMRLQLKKKEGKKKRKKRTSSS